MFSVFQCPALFAIMPLVHILVKVLSGFAAGHYLNVVAAAPNFFG